MDTITLSHGAGGRETSRLIEDVFLDAFGRDADNGNQDAAVLEASGRIAFTSDSFVVRPLFFPGGDIGRLAVCGTVNDLLTSGAVPKYLSASFILEEGLEVSLLRSIAVSMAKTAEEAGVRIVTGDTKVIEGGGGLCISASGIGMVSGKALTFGDARPNDALIVTGKLGSHHACIMSARMGIENDIRSDANPLCAIVSALAAQGIPVHGMRDVTRGGLATILWEISKRWGLGALLEEERLPVNDSVRGFCAIFGLDALYMSNEGVMLLAVPAEFRESALEAIRSAPYGSGAACIGYFTEDKTVTMHTEIGGHRIIPPLAGESLPRIC